MIDQNNDLAGLSYESALEQLRLARTELNQLRQENSILQAGIAQMQSVLDTIPGQIYVKDIAGHYLVVNTGFEQSVGVSRNAILGKTLREAFPSQSVDEFEENDRDVIEANRVIEKEWKIYKPELERHVHFLSLSFPMHDSSDNIYATGGIITNITARKLAEERAHTSNQQMRAVLDHTPAVIYMKDMEGRYILVNSLFAKFTDLSPEEIVGKTSYDLFLKEAADTISVNDRLAIEAGKPVEHEWSIFNHQRQQNEIYLTTTFPLRDQDGTIYAVCGMTSDITARRQAEETKRQTITQEEIIRAQEMALAELTTPLLSITDQAVVMPLIGSLDSRRTQQIIAALLEGVAHHRSQVAILDITGVSVVDTQVANALIQAAQAVQLLGARVVITGIRPEIAQTLVNLGVNLQNIMTMNSLQNGISYAMRFSTPDTKVR